MVTVHPIITFSLQSQSAFSKCLILNCLPLGGTPLSPLTEVLLGSASFRGSTTLVSQNLVQSKDASASLRGDASGDYIRET